MARPQKLTDRQRDEIRKRLASGETQRALATEFAVSVGTISSLFAGRSETIKTLANTLATTEKQVELLSVSEQILVRNLADQQKAMHHDYTRGASVALKNAVKMHEMASTKVNALDPLTVETEDLRVVAALTETANKAASMCASLIAANKGKAESASSLEDLVVSSGKAS